MRYTPSGRAVASFSLATSERWTGQDGQKNESTTWHNIVAWGKQAEIIKEYLTKGREVYIEGRIDNRSYDDKEGNKRYTTEINANVMQMLGGQSQAESGQSGAGSDDEPNPAADDFDSVPF